MSSEETTGYHLFFEPAGAVKEKLATYIRTLAHEYGGPVFPPHITLLGSIQEYDEERVIANATALARELAPLTLTLGDVEGESTYFRAFYLPVEDPEAITTYYERACTVFELPIHEYLPHLSLFYGTPSDAVRTDMTASLAYMRGDSVVIDSLSVYQGEGRAEEWRKIAQISFR